MQHYRRKQIATFLLIIFTTTLPPSQLRAGSLGDLASQVTQLMHVSTNSAGWINNAAQEAVAQATRINQLEQAITNNVFTQAIQGFSQLQTALQTDMSSVLGLAGDITNFNPLRMLQELMGSVMQLPSSIMGLFGSVGNSSRLPNFNVPSNYGGSNGLFSTIQNTLSGSLSGDDISSSPFGSGNNLANSLSATRTAAAGSFLGNSHQRQQNYEAVDRELTTAATATESAYNTTNSVKIQALGNKIAATQTRMQLQIVRNQDRDQEMASLDREQDAADRAAVYEQLKANTARTYSQTDQWIETMTQ